MDENITPAAGAQSSEIQTAHPLAKVEWQKLIEQGLSLLQSHTSRTGLYTAILMGAVIVAFTGLAAMALYLNHVDTSEKLMIALISFLGGAAIFGGNVKK